MNQSAAEIVREYGPFPGVASVNGVTYDGQHIWRASSFNDLHDVIKTPNARGIRENVWIAYQLIDDLLLSAPIIAEAAQIRDNEV